MSEKNVCSNIIMRYINNMVLLDDDFKTVKLNSDTPDVSSFPEAVDPTMSDPADSEYEKDPTANKEAVKDSPLMDLLTYCRKNNLNLFPYEYTDDFSIFHFLEYTQHTTCLILDWGMQKRDEIYKNIFNSYGKGKRLKFLTIYTDESDLHNVHRQISIIANDLNLKENVINEENCLYQFNSLIVYIQNKAKCDLAGLLRIFAQEMIDDLGGLFFAVIQYSQIIEERSSEVLSYTANPFSKLAIIQMLKSDASPTGFNRVLNQVISENTTAFASIPPETSDYIRESSIDTLKMYARANTFITDCQDFYQNNKTDKPDLLKVNQESLYSKLNDKVDELFDYFCASNFCKINGEQIKGKISPTVKSPSPNDYSTLLDCIITGSIKPNGTTDYKHHYGDALLKLLEFTKYDKYPDVDFIASLFSKEPLSVDDTFTIGDVFEKTEDDPLLPDYLLCITPECDAVRLSTSTNQKILFIPGHIKEWSWFKDQVNSKYPIRMGNYYSVVPCLSKENRFIVPVLWDFFDVHPYDLKIVDQRNKLLSFKRFYRMRTDYAKQLQAKFISYFMRNGVDELFIKDKNVSFGNMMIDIMK